MDYIYRLNTVRWHLKNPNGDLRILNRDERQEKWVRNFILHDVRAKISRDILILIGFEKLYRKYYPRLRELENCGHENYFDAISVVLADIRGDLGIWRGMSESSIHSVGSIVTMIKFYKRNIQYPYIRVGKNNKKAEQLTIF